MRILFTLLGNSRRSNYLTGDTIRNGGGGGSGTDTSTILVAEYLASQGHEVVVVSDELEPLIENNLRKNGCTFKWGTVSRGVTYSNFKFDNVENKTFDILVNSLWFHNYDSLPVTITKGLVYWCHMQWVYGMSEIASFAKKHSLKLAFVHISEWETKCTQGIVDAVCSQVESAIVTLIPNPVFDEIITETLNKNIAKKPHKFIFHASWPRGGNVAVDAVRQLPYEDKEFHAFDYLMVIHAHQDPFFHMHNGVDKQTLFQHLAESEYFIYPLYTPYQDVHKDTFSCVVAEALALGTTVLTYPLGALPEYYDGFVQWLDFPAGASAEQMQNEPLSKDYEGIFKSTANIVEKIKHLEANPHLKEATRIKARESILSRFNINKIGSMWSDLLNKMT